VLLQFTIIVYFFALNLTLSTVTLTNDWLNNIDSSSTSAAVA